MIALGLHGGTVEIVDEVSGLGTRSFHGHSGSTGSGNRSFHGDHGSGPTVVSVSPDGRFVISVCQEDRQCKLWDCFGDLNMASPVHDVNLNIAYPVHDGTGDCECDGDGIFMPICPYMRSNELLVAAISPCGKWFAVAGSGGDLWLWDMKHKVMNVVHTTSLELDTISFSGDGNFLCCGGPEPYTHIVHVASGTVTKTWDGGAGGCFCPTNNNLVTTADRYCLTLWNIENDTIVWQTMSSNNEYDYKNFAVFSPDGLFIATSDQFHYPDDSDEEHEYEGSKKDPVDVSVVHAATGKKKFQLLHTRDAVIRDVAFSPCGDKLVTVEEIIREGGTCRMYDMSTGDILWTTARNHAIYSVDWSRDYLRDQMRIAFAMGGISRLGETSRVLPLDHGVVKMILNGS